MEKLIKILEDIKDGVDYEKEERLISDGILDSIDLVAIMSDLEEEFDISITYDMLTEENFNSARAIWNMISSLKGKVG